MGVIKAACVDNDLEMFETVQGVTDHRIAPVNDVGRYQGPSADVDALRYKVAGFKSALASRVATVERVQSVLGERDADVLEVRANLVDL